MVDLHDGRAVLTVARPGERRCVRASSWCWEPAFARVSSRYWGSLEERGNGLGFRLARSFP